MVRWRDRRAYRRGRHAAGDQGGLDDGFLAIRWRAVRVIAIRLLLSRSFLLRLGLGLARKMLILRPPGVAKEGGCQFTSLSVWIAINEKAASPVLKPDLDVPKGHVKLSREGLLDRTGRLLSLAEGGL